MTTDEEEPKICGHEADGKRCLMRPWHTDPDMNLPHFVIFTEVKKNRKKLRK